MSRFAVAAALLASWSAAAVAGYLLWSPVENTTGNVEVDDATPSTPHSSASAPAPLPSTSTTPSNPSPIQNLAEDALQDEIERLDRLEALVTARSRAPDPEKARQMRAVYTKMGEAFESLELVDVDCREHPCLATYRMHDVPGESATVPEIMGWVQNNGGDPEAEFSARTSPVRGEMTLVIGQQSREPTTAEDRRVHERWAPMFAAQDRER